MEVVRVRVANLRRLIGAGVGKQRAFADLHGLNPAHLSQILNGHRDMGHKFARKLEAKLGMELGAMDHEPEPADSIGHALAADELSMLTRYRAAGPRWRLAINLLLMVSTTESQDEVAGMVNMVIAKVSGMEPGRIQYRPDAEIKAILGDAPHVVARKLARSK